MLIKENFFVVCLILIIYFIDLMADYYQFFWIIDVKFEEQIDWLGNYKKFLTFLIFYTEKFINLYIVIKIINNRLLIFYNC